MLKHADRIVSSRRIPSSQADIVDQASFPEEHSNREQRIRSDRINRSQGFRIDQLHIINSSRGASLITLLTRSTISLADLLPAFSAASKALCKAAACSRSSGFKY